jgi:hypothetical protein
MSVARDFDDDFREHGPAAVQAALDAAQWVGPEFAPIEGTTESVTLPAKPFVWRDEAAIPPRQWLYGRHLIRKFLSVDVAAGGVGKSSVKIVEALAMASGRNLLGKDIYEGPLTVWLYNLEDPEEEIERRLHAARRYYDIDPSELGDRLYVNSGRDQPVVLAEETPHGARILRPVADALIATLKEREIDVLTLDPFVSSHAINENDNRAIDLVSKEYGRIADLCGCSINLVHHVRKQNGQEANADSARGASALIGTARSVIVYNRMTKEEGERAGIEPSKVGFHFRTQTDKANLAPPESADWHRMNNVELANGDQVGVACPWSWPDAFTGISTNHLKEVQRRVNEGDWRVDIRAGEQWVGVVISEVTDIDRERYAGRIKDIIKNWIQTDMLRIVEKEDRHRKLRKFVEVGTWHTD